MSNTIFDELIEDLKRPINLAASKILDNTVLLSTYTNDRLWILRVFSLEINSALSSTTVPAKLRYLNIMKNTFGRFKKVSESYDTEADGFFKVINRYDKHDDNYLLVSLIEDAIGESLNDNWHKWAKE